MHLHHAAWLAGAAALAVAPLRAQTDERLANAMRNQELGTVRALVAEGVHVNAQDAATTTALHWAARWGELEAVRLLLDAGADPNIANRFGVTPLHEAALRADEAMIAVLLSAGADPNASYGEGEAVLMTAARTGNAAAVKRLLEHGAAVDAAEGWHGQTALMWAAVEGHPRVAEVLIAHGADVNRRSTEHDWVEIGEMAGSTPKLRDVGGLTALHFAAREGASEVADLLIAAGADTAATEPMYELTALQLAIVNGHWRMAARLITHHGVDVDDGSLYLAIDTRNLGHYPQRPNPQDYDDGLTHLDVIRLLLEHGADPDLAYTKGIPERTYGAPIDVPEGATPLDRAAAAPDVEVIRLLMAHGANPSVAAKDGTTPLMLLSGYARRGSGPQVAGDPVRAEAIELLLAAGADLDAAQLESGNTAAHYAAMRGAGEILDRFARRGADLDARNAAGATPADLAAASQARAAE